VRIDIRIEDLEMELQYPLKAQSPVVYDRTVVRCKWCLGQIRIYVSKIRRKESSSDIGRIRSVKDYHEDCWCEAIEVQI
jgi:hypothetical protein